MRDSKFEKARKRALKVNQQSARRFCAAMTRKSGSRKKGRRLGESLQFETVLPARTRIYRQATAECSARSLVLGAATLCKRLLGISPMPPQHRDRRLPPRRAKPFLDRLSTGATGPTGPLAGCSPIADRSRDRCFPQHAELVKFSNSTVPKIVVAFDVWAAPFFFARKAKTPALPRHRGPRRMREGGRGDLGFTPPKKHYVVYQRGRL